MSHSTTRLTPKFSRVSSASKTPHRRRDAISTDQKKNRLTFQSTSKKASESPSIIQGAEEEGDRFVPTRGQTSSSKQQFDFEGFQPSKPDEKGTAYKKDERNRLLYQSLFDEPIKPKALFSFSGRKRQAQTQQGPFDHDSIRLVPPPTDKDSNKRTKMIRRQQEISSKPYKILDAPDLRPDYYLHLLSWSKDDVLAVALKHTVYLWKKSQATRLMTVPKLSNINHYITSLSWSNVEPKYLAIASSSGSVYVYDTISGACVRGIKPKRTQTIGESPEDITMVLAWNGSVVSAGSKKGLIVFWDFARSKQLVEKVVAHQSTVCSLDWNTDGLRLASGGNDNLVHIQDIRKLRGVHSTLRGHKAGIKALSWCPFKTETLVSGGGTEDRCIKIWKYGELQESIETDSQVTSFEWNPCQRELISATGFPVGKLVFWQFPSMEKITQVQMRGERILFTAMSPDHSTIISGGSDELLAFWQVNPQRDTGSLDDSSTFPACPIR